MILLKLKQETQQYHDKIERDIDIVNKHLSLEDYTQLLKKFWGFYSPVEARIDGIQGKNTFSFDFKNRKKAFLLKNDLNTLGVLDVDVQKLPLCADIPTIENLSQTSGCLYVLEGATLGGQIITKRVKQLFGFTEGHGCTFFNSYGQNVGTMWKSFCSKLVDYTTTEQAEEMVIQAACETFIKLNTWLLEGDGR